MRIYLVTHAHTEQMPDVAVDAWRLSARGQEQAAKLATEPFWDEVDRVVVSSEPKTWATVSDVVHKRPMPVWIDSRFDELRRSGWTENYAAQVAAVFAEPLRSAGGWESVDNVRRRVWDGLDDLQRRFAGERLVLVGHGLCLSILRAEILGQTQVDFTAWQRLVFGAHAAVLIDPPTMLKDFDVSVQPQR